MFFRVVYNQLGKDPFVKTQEPSMKECKIHPSSVIETQQSVVTSQPAQISQLENESSLPGKACRAVARSV